MIIDSYASPIVNDLSYNYKKIREGDEKAYVCRLIDEALPQTVYELGSLIRNDPQLLENVSDLTMDDVANLCGGLSSYLNFDDSSFASYIRAFVFVKVYERVKSHTQALLKLDDL